MPRSVLFAGCLGTYFGDHKNQVLLGHVGWQASPSDVGWNRRYWQDSTDGRQNERSVWRLHGGQYPLQLLHNLRNVAENSGETIGKESRPKLWTSWYQAFDLLCRRHEHARGKINFRLQLLLVNICVLINFLRKFSNLKNDKDVDLMVLRLKRLDGQQIDHQLFLRFLKMNS